MKNSGTPTEKGELCPIDRRRFLTLGGVAAGACLLQPSRARATGTILPVSGIYVLAPPPNYLLASEKKAFYTTPGLTGVVVNPVWNQIQTGTQHINSFTPLDMMLDDIFNNNPNLKVALGIGAGINFPSYMYNPVIYKGNSYTIPNLNIMAGTGGTGNYESINFPFPFDPAYIQCYLDMLSKVFSHLSALTINGVHVINQITSVKLSLFTGPELEIQIPSWDEALQNPSQAQAWLDAYTTEGTFASGAAGSSSWPGLSATSWQATIKSAWTGFVQSVVTLLPPPLSSTVTLSAPMHSPTVSFPMIDADGNVDTYHNDNSAFAFCLMELAAMKVANPFQTINTALSIITSDTGAPYTLSYYLGSNSMVNEGPTAYAPYLAFQTNAWSGGFAASGPSNKDAIPLDPSNPNDVITFKNLLAFGMMDPKTQSPSTYLYTDYNYPPYIEVHYTDVTKWGTILVPGSGGTPMFQAAWAAVQP